ncbi:TPA: hypothetical protein RQK13_004211 [Vibrio vulnificus]|nr:hypothetical protein [Vibrio vulnificus]
MSKGTIKFFLYQKDFSEKGNDRYFILENDYFKEVDLKYIVSIDCFLVTHDFWLISSSIFKKCRTLPKKIIDVVLLGKIISGTKPINGGVQSWDVHKAMDSLFHNKKDLESYFSMYYRRSELDLNIYLLFSHKLSEYFDILSKSAHELGERERFYKLELPIFNLLTLSSCKGIRVDNNIVRNHKIALKYDYYRDLKVFSEKHNVMYELPNEQAVIEKLTALGYDVEGYSIDFLIDLLPSKDGYTLDLRKLQKTYKSYRVLSSISVSSSRLHPIVESHWTTTSRIYHKSPSIQNISKKYRDIFIPDKGKTLCYVDYDQFEVGVMAFISSDAMMVEIYNNSDAYEDLSLKVFNDKNMRKKAKLLFLSYTYGMSMENILRSVSELGGDVVEAKNYFSGFKDFEIWKTSIWDAFLKNGKIATINGNLLKRVSDKELTDKEKRSSVNHVIQGTATYIFKLALLELSKIDGLDVLIPMHDAVLVQHDDKVKPESIKMVFERVMSEVLPGIEGKASIESFFTV